jgi:HD-like signal output (HDOD) protein
MIETIQRTRDALMEAIESRRLVLPTLPEVALKVRDATRNPEIDIASLTKLIQGDTALSAGIIKAANSALLRAPRPIDDLRSAVGRIGINCTSNLATSLAMRQMFRSKSPVVDSRLRATWARSTAVAGIAHVLARHYTRLKPDEATLAGIVHRIGVLPILTYAEQQPQLLNDPVVLDEMIEDLHPMIGRAILDSWSFPAELVAVPAEYLTFERKVPRADYADLIMVANLQTYIGTEHPFAAMDWSKVGAFARVGLSPEVASLEVDGLSADMEAAAVMLE